MVARGMVILSWAPSTSAVTPANAAVTDKVEFVTGLETVTTRALLEPDATLALIDGTVGTDRNRADNPLPYAQTIEAPDTGTNGFERTYRFKVMSPSTSEGLTRLRNWSRQDNAPNSQHRHGRISLADTVMPAYDLNANSSAGYQIAQLGIDTDYYTGVVIGTLTLRFSGDPARLGAA